MSKTLFGWPIRNSDDVPTGKIEVGTKDVTRAELEQLPSDDGVFRFQLKDSKEIERRIFDGEIVSEIDWAAEAIRQQTLREKAIVRCLEMTSRWMASERKVMDLERELRAIKIA